MNTKKSYINQIEKSNSLLMCSDEVKRFIGCQFALESNFGKSRISKEINNHCGMKQPFKRPTLDVYPIWEEKDENQGFCTFDDMEECIQDYLLWLTWNHFTMDELNDLEKFKLHLFKAKYCPEMDYIKRIENIYDNYENLK